MLSNLSFSVFHGSAFVASMYSLQSTSDNSLRNDWPVILKRMMVSSIFTGISYWISERTTNTEKRESLKSFFCEKPMIAAKMVGTLFLGVLVEWGFHYGARVFKSLRKQENENTSFNVVDSTILKTVCRDLTIAPLTEEIVFRGSIHKRHLFEAFPSSPVSRTLISAIIFSLAHVHHAFERIEDKKQFRINKRKFINSAIPPLLFGLMSGVLVEKGVGILPLALAHSFCNLVGPPKWSIVVTNDEVVREVVLWIPRDDANYQRTDKIVGVANKLFLVMHLCCIGGFVYQSCVY